MPIYLGSTQLTSSGGGGVAPGTGGFTAVDGELVLDYTPSTAVNFTPANRFFELPAAAAFSRSFFDFDDDRLMIIEVVLSDSSTATNDYPFGTPLVIRMKEWRDLTATANNATPDNVHGWFIGTQLTGHNTDFWQRSVIGKGVTGRIGLSSQRAGYLHACRVYLSPLNTTPVGSSRGRLVGSTSALPTASVARGSNLAPPPGLGNRYAYHWVNKQVGYGDTTNNGGPVLQGANLTAPALFFAPLNPPSREVIGLWVRTEVGNVYKHTIGPIPWGPGVLTDETATDDKTKATLLFRGGGTNDNGALAKVILVWEVTSSGYAQLSLEGDGTELPGNSTVEIYEAVVRGDTGDKGEAGDAASGGGITYPSLAGLPSAATLATGTRAKVVTSTAVMDFMVNATSQGVRSWLCAGGTSDDLVNTNLNFTASGRVIAPTGVPRWDFRFPFFLMSFGATSSTSTDDMRWWVSVDAGDISTLATTQNGEVVTAASTKTLEVSVHYRPGNAGFSVRKYWLCRGANNEILIASTNATLDAYPFRLRGTS